MIHGERYLITSAPVAKPERPAGPGPFAKLAGKPLLTLLFFCDQASVGSIPLVVKSTLITMNPNNP